MLELVQLVLIWRNRRIACDIKVEGRPRRIARPRQSPLLEARPAAVFQPSQQPYTLIRVLFAEDWGMGSLGYRADAAIPGHGGLGWRNGVEDLV
jgi:hypothetical protein